jgi:hypothetical protein
VGGGFKIRCRKVPSFGGSVLIVKGLSRFDGWMNIITFGGDPFPRLTKKV